KKNREDKAEDNKKLQSCLENVNKNNHTLIEKNKEIQEKTDQAKIRDAQNSLLTSRINDISQNLTKANKRLLEFDEIKSEVNNKLHSCLENLNKNNRNLIEKDKEIQEKTDQAKITDAQNSLLTSRINDISQNLTKANKRLFEFYEQVNACTTAEKGIYNITLPGVSAFEAPCNGSGWTVIQRRIDGSVDFNRSWTEYRDGFGNLTGEFFIGLEKLYQITQSGQYELLISLGKVNGSRDFVKYDNIKIGSEENSYRLESIGNHTEGAHDTLKYYVNMKFSTIDRDNDLYPGNCAQMYGGGWWFHKCTYSNLNGKYYKDGKRNDNLYGILWSPWNGYDFNVLLTFDDEMMIRPKPL
ncbi:hypothetical protein KR074_011014, partial [Drosophila pseudoananassae]